MSDKTRAAMQKALNLIEGEWPEDDEIAQSVINEIREALEQSVGQEPVRDSFIRERQQLEQEWCELRKLQQAYTAPQPAQEPVARVSGYYGGRCVVEPISGATVFPKDMALYATPVQQAEQEPYAYEVWDVQDQSFTMIYATQLKEFHWIEQDDIARVLYAAPVRTKDLTDDEILPDGYGVVTSYDGLLEFARAVIAAYKAKQP